ncbi:hypothetical protein [Streptomyces sp. NPDC056144]|uniref:hypothetical protein n=1 Tax=unclassified Streptomyces TaxID=2593676 RepID=UPI0035D8D9B0
MTPRQGKRWYSLGMLIGGHTQVSDDTHYYRPARWVAPEREEEATEVMDHAGRSPTSRHPGT